MKTRLNVWNIVRENVTCSMCQSQTGTEEWQDLINNFATNSLLVQIIAICSHATEHWVQETDKMLKIQTKLDRHTSKQPLLLLFPSRRRLVKLEFTLWFSCSCHETLFNKGANCVQWSRWRSEAVLIPSLKREQNVQCGVKHRADHYSERKTFFVKFYPLYIIPSILDHLPTGQYQVNHKRIMA